MKMGIRQELSLKEKGQRTYFPLTCHTLSRKDKKSYCVCLQGIKVPKGYSSNLNKLVMSRCNNVYHWLFRTSCQKNMRDTITRICLFFNSICNKVIDP